MRNKIGLATCHGKTCIMRGTGGECESCSGAEEHADLEFFLFVAVAEDERRETVRRETRSHNEL